MFCVWMQLTTSVKSITTSFPTVMAAMTFLTASFFFSIFGLASSSLSSWISPFLVVWKYFESLPEDEVPPKLGNLVFIAPPLLRPQTGYEGEVWALCRHISRARGRGRRGEMVVCRVERDERRVRKQLLHMLMGAETGASGPGSSLAVQTPSSKF